MDLFFLLKIYNKKNQEASQKRACKLEHAPFLGAVDLLGKINI
jgi:hypothetical protein